MCLACNREYDGSLTNCPVDSTALIAIKQGDDFIGQTLGGVYYVTEEIGRGGMGVVYLARHQMMDRLVAIKMLQAELLSDEMSVKRFKQEAQAASCLSHPHIITLHDFGILNTGQPYLVMEYLEGVPLLHVIKRLGPLDPPRAVKIFSEVADALHHAHIQGIVHRDLKPSNIILINKDGDPDFVKVVDFGLAKLMPWSGKESQHLTKTGEVFGSPIYMSPEQCMGKPLGPTSDVYSLGITLFEALTGKPPFRGSNSIQTASKHMSEAPPRFVDVRPDLMLPENLERVVLKTLAKEPSERFQDMAEFKDALLSAFHNDAKVEIPPSLMVSRHQIPVVPDQSKTVSVSGIPAVDFRAGQESQRRVVSTDASRGISAKKGLPFHPALLAVPVVLLALGGGATYFMSQPIPKEAAGEITFVDRQKNEMHIWDTDKQVRHVLTIDNTSHNIEDFQDRVEQTGLGAKIAAKYNASRFGDQNNGVYVDGTRPTGAEGWTPGVKQAVTAVSNMLESLAYGEYSAAAEDLRTGQTAAELEKKYPKDSMLRLFRISASESKPPENTVDRRWGHAFKLVSDKNGEVVLLIDKSLYYVPNAVPKQPYWKAVVSGTYITSFDDAPESEWNKY